LKALRLPVVLIALLLFACSSATETTVPQALADMPEECIDALVTYLQAVEPAVEDVDFEDPTGPDIEALSSEIAELTQGATAEFESIECPDPLGGDDVARFEAVIAIAEQEAPGTVGYLEWVAGLATGFGDSSEVSGDCETDITALQAIVGEGETMSDLTMTQVIEVGSLVASISTSCSPERAEEFFAEEDVAAFLEEG
jgi:hypothetical protein